MDVGTHMLTARVMMQTIVRAAGVTANAVERKFATTTHHWIAGNSVHAVVAARGVAARRVVGMRI